MNFRKYISDVTALGNSCCFDYPQRLMVVCYRFKNTINKLLCGDSRIIENFHHFPFNIGIIMAAGKAAHHVIFIKTGTACQH